MRIFGLGRSKYRIVQLIELLLSVQFCRSLSGPQRVILLHFGRVGGKIVSCGKMTKSQTSFGFDVELRLDVGFATVPILLLGKSERAFFMSECLHLWSSELMDCGGFHERALEHGRLTSDHFCDDRQWLEPLVFQPHHWLRSMIHCSKIIYTRDA